VLSWEEDEEEEEGEREIASCESDEECCWDVEMYLETEMERVESSLSAE